MFASPIYPMLSVSTYDHKRINCFIWSMFWILVFLIEGKLFIWKTFWWNLLPSKPLQNQLRLKWIIHNTLRHLFQKSIFTIFRLKFVSRLIFSTFVLKFEQYFHGSNHPILMFPFHIYEFPGANLFCFVLGSAHAVDSSELAFRLAAIGAIKQGTHIICRNNFIETHLDSSMMQSGRTICDMKSQHFLFHEVRVRQAAPLKTP